MTFALRVGPPPYHLSLTRRINLIPLQIAAATLSPRTAAACERSTYVFQSVNDRTEGSIVSPRRKRRKRRPVIVARGNCGTGNEKCRGIRGRLITQKYANYSRGIIDTAAIDGARFSATTYRRYVCALRIGSSPRTRARARISSANISTRTYTHRRSNIRRFEYSSTMSAPRTDGRCRRRSRQLWNFARGRERKGAETSRARSMDPR